MNRTKNKINIVFASDNDYAQHAAVAMASILMHTEMPEDISFYLLADDVTEEYQQKMHHTVEKFGAELTIIPMDAEAFAAMFVSGQLSRAAYFRLEMANLLPAKVEKAIYLDCDLVVYDDIRELWSIDLSGHPVGAIADYGIMASHKDWQRKQQTLGFTTQDRYFNSGVLVVDVKKWREHDYGSQAAQAARANDYQHHDQDALNKLFYRDWQELPLRWNVIPPIWNMFIKILRNAAFRRTALAARRDIAILHYAGGYKPWEYPEIEAFNAEYYRCFRETAFCDMPMPQPNKRRKGRSLKRQLCRLKIADFWQRIF